MNAPVVIEDLRYSAIEDEVRANVGRCWRGTPDGIRLKRTESTQLTDLALWTKLATEMVLPGSLYPRTVAAQARAGERWPWSVRNSVEL